MPRPKKRRYVCCMPENRYFGPENGGNGNITLTVDEYEVIRLIDVEGSTQEECANQMHVARSTVTSIYTEARRKIGTAIVNGLSLNIDGGDYLLCRQYNDTCGKGCKGSCHRHQCDATQESEETLYQPDLDFGGRNMIVAVTYKDGEIFQHFGHAEQFKFYYVEDNKVVKTLVADTKGSGHGALTSFLSDNDVDVLVCGGIGGGAKEALKKAKIVLFGGAEGNADEAVDNLLAGTLVFNKDVHCDHHSQGEGHTCGDNGCGGGCHSNN